MDLHLQKCAPTLLPWPGALGSGFLDANYGIIFDVDDCLPAYLFQQVVKRAFFNGWFTRISGKPVPVPDYGFFPANRTALICLQGSRKPK